MGNQQRAMAHYEHVTNLFYRELGVKPSERLRNLYREIIKNVQHVKPIWKSSKRTCGKPRWHTALSSANTRCSKTSTGWRRAAERTGQLFFCCF